MEDQELLNMWKSYERKLDEVLEINRNMVIEATKGRLQKTIGKLRRPKSMAILIGIPYTLLLYAIAGVALKAGGVFQSIGFGAIGLITTVVIVLYAYHLYLVGQITGEDDIQYVQKRLSRLRLSSFNCLRLAIVQLPFWVLCWISLDAVIESPLVYGGVNLLVLLLFTYLAYWLFQQLGPQKPPSRVKEFFLSGSEWEPLTKSFQILEQLEDSK